MKRSVRIALVSVSLLIGLVVLLRAWSRWSEGRALAAAREDLSNGRVAPARARLTALAERNPGHSETEYLLGIAEEASGDMARAVAAWSRVPAGSPEYPDSAVRLGKYFDSAGKPSEAERILTEALANPGDRLVDLRQLLIGSYWKQGRLDEARRLIEANYIAVSEKEGPVAPSALALLRTHLSMDLDPFPLDRFEKQLREESAKSPDDDRLKLALANVADRTGRYDEAEKLLAECVARRPKDPAVRRAMLDHALAVDSLERVEAAVEHLTTNDVSRARVYEVAAWIARKRGDPLFEKGACRNLVDADRGHTAALERLAELELVTGQSAAAVEARKRKAEIDAAKRDYRGMLQSDYTQVAGEMLPLAEKLGRVFEAFGFMAITMNRKPSEARNHPIYGQFHRVGADPILGAGQPLKEAMAIEFIGGGPAAPVAVQPKGDDWGPIPRFDESAARSGLNFTYRNGRSPIRQLPETMSGGIGVLDYDGDGLLDVYAVQGGSFPPDRRPSETGDRLFRNLGNGNFRDVTEAAGLPPKSVGYGLGVAVGDIDNDGRPDLFVTRWRAFALYRNKGDGTFEEITARAGLAGDQAWSTSAAFGDLDNDGDLDLYVCRYLDWDQSEPRPCRDGNGGYSYCDPRLLPALPDRLYRNDGGKFVDVTTEAGIVDKDGRGLGVVIADLDGDGLVDIFVANDGTANLLFHNKGDFKFEEVAAVSGVAGNAEGGFQAGMGVACGDFDGDERPDLVVTNFYGESSTYYQNLGEGMFADRTVGIGLGAATRTLLGFGAVLADLNNDGRLDFASTNGHVNDLRPVFPYAMPCTLLLGGRSGRIRDVSAELGEAWTKPRVGRGLAWGDLDNDGNIDLLVLSQNDPLAFFRNRGTPGQQSIGFLLEGTKSNRDGVGAKVRVKAGGTVRVLQRFGGGSYQSAGDPRLHLGLGSTETVDEVVVTWPSGRMDRHIGLKAGRIHRLREGESNAGVR